MPVPLPMIRRPARAVFALALFALSLAAPAAAQPAPGDGDGMRVLASRREVRVVFPPEPAGPLGWTADDVRAGQVHRWSMVVGEAVGGPSLVSLQVVARDSARAFPSLAELVAAGETAVCDPGLSGPCAGDVATAGVEDGRVVLVLRDSAEIARLFGLRPAHVSVSRVRLDVHSNLPRDSVPVEYGEPAIPAPDAALRARSARLYAALLNHYHRRIHGGEGDDTPTLWMEVGDTLVLSVRETHCVWDYCSEDAEVVRDAGWTVSDSTVARLLPPEPGRAYFRMSPPRRLVGLREGSTRVTVTGLASPSDTLPGADSLPRTLTREIIVRRPLARVALTASDTTVAVGRTVTIRAAAIDERGARMEGAPIRMEVVLQGRTHVRTGPDPFHVAFPAPGTYVVTGSFASATDTLVITVVPAPAAADPMEPGDGR